MALYSSPGEPASCDDEIIYIQRSVPPYDDGFRRRLWGLITVVLISLCLLLGRTWQLQILQGDYFLRLSEQNRLRSLRTKSLRGKILDRHGYVLADNRAAYTLMAIPADLPARDGPRAAWRPGFPWPAPGRSRSRSASEQGGLT